LIVGNSFKIIGAGKEGSQFHVEAWVILHQTGKLTLHPTVPPSGFASALKDKGLRRMETGEIRCATCFVGPAMRVEQLLCFGQELMRFFKKSDLCYISAFE
jgi:hypothetical protein